MNSESEQSIPSRGSHGMDVPLLLDAIGDCLAQVDPFNQRCVVVLNTPERKKAHKALFRLKQMFSDDAEASRKLKEITPSNSELIEMAKQSKPPDWLAESD